MGGVVGRHLVCIHLTRGYRDVLPFGDGRDSCLSSSFGLVREASRVGLEKDGVWWGPPGQARVDRCVSGVSDDAKRGQMGRVCLVCIASEWREPRDEGCNASVGGGHGGGGGRRRETGGSLRNYSTPTTVVGLFGVFLARRGFVRLSLSPSTTCFPISPPASTFQLSIIVEKRKSFNPPTRYEPSYRPPASSPSTAKMPGIREFSPPPPSRDLAPVSYTAIRIADGFLLPIQRSTPSIT